MRDNRDIVSLHDCLDLVARFCEDISKNLYLNNLMFFKIYILIYVYIDFGKSETN
jgi:hypothetical protein